MPGPLQPFADFLHYTKYRHEGEKFEGYVDRAARTLADDADHEASLRDIFGDNRFMPAGRVQAWVGSDKVVTPYNCLGRDTEILTREFGMRPIGDLEGMNIHVMDGNGDWQLTKVENFGMQELFAVSMFNGGKRKTILATMGHAWISKGVRVLTSSVKIIDFFSASKKEGVDYGRGVVHGLVYGDGSATNDGGFNIRVCSDHEDVCPWLEGFPTSNPPSANGDPYYYFYGDNAWCDFKALPSIECSLQYLLGFIRGWLAADGSVSDQPEVTLCGDLVEKTWLKQFGPLVGFYVTGSSALSPTTNFGPRKKASLNIRFDLRSVVQEDLLIRRKRARLKSPSTYSWSVSEVSSSRVALDEVFCVQVKSTQSFVIEGGVLSGNCYVSPSIHDSFVDGPKTAEDDLRSVSIMDAAKLAAQTMRQGGGIGYDFSTLRPSGDLIKGVRAKTDGPIAFMPVYDAVCKATSSAGNRRGAQMGVLRVDHPDILKFVTMKNNNDFLNGFNTSVGVTDEFMEAVARNGTFDLRFGGRVYQTVDAAELWHQIMESTYHWAEPGVLFIDTINKMNNLYYCERIAATNPCGEQPLPPYGACLLGSFNAVKYLVHVDGVWKFDMHRFIADIAPVVRAMDNVIDKAIYPLPEQAVEAKSKRRMGLGITGLANALEAMGLPYGTAKFVAMEDTILRNLRDHAYIASVGLAKEKGAFPLYDEHLYPRSKFIETLPYHIQDMIVRFGIRNSHLTSIAPTGTISFAADNVSSSIEPVFALEQERPVNLPDGKQVLNIPDYGYRFLGVRGRTTAQVSVDDHLAVFLTAAKLVDSAVSKTINMDKRTSMDEFKTIYQRAYEGGAKGCTTFNKDGKRFALLQDKDGRPEADTGPEEASALMEGATCYRDPVTGLKTCE